MSDTLVIHVDSEGRDKNGNVYDHAAMPEMVRDGYMINRPVLVKYPDGRVMTGTEVLFTQRGMEKLKREYPIEARRVEGRA
jgi:hypothetical protein